MDLNFTNPHCNELILPNFKPIDSTILAKYSVSSKREFLEKIHSNKLNISILVSLDFENHFAYVLVKESINILNIEHL